MTKQAEHVKHRRARELCAHPGCPEKTGDDFRCPAHKAAHTAAQNARNRARRAKEQAA